LLAILSPNAVEFIEIGGLDFVKFTVYTHYSFAQNPIKIAGDFL
jgi:hypothetical protein